MNISNKNIIKFAIMYGHVDKYFVQQCFQTNRFTVRIMFIATNYDSYALQIILTYQRAPNCQQSKTFKCDVHT